jgi:two-component sensor histidine kinase
MRSLRDLPISQKLNLLAMATCLVALLVASGLFLAYQRIVLFDEHQQGLLTLAEVTGQNCRAAIAFADQREAEDVMRSLEAHQAITAVGLYAQDGRRLAEYLRRGATPPPAFLPREQFAWLRQDGYRLRLTRPVMLNEEVIGTLYLDATLHSLADLYRRSLLIVGTACVGSALLAFLLALRLRRLVTAPMSRLLEATRTVASAQDFSVRVPVVGDDELGRLMTAFNEMLGEIETRDAALRASLGEKEVLLREIHHRVKNNMQIISSLLRMEARTHPGGLEEVFRDCQGRVHSMALVHERLYRSTDLARIDFAAYLADLLRGLGRAYQLPGITLRAHAADMWLSIDQAVPCGLLVNELVTNSLKHAFPPGARGQVEVMMSTVDAAMVELLVSDTGSGLPSDLDPNTHDSLGIRLIRTLAESQLDGTLAVTSSAHGTRVCIRFPVGGAVPAPPDRAVYPHEE